MTGQTNESARLKQYISYQRVESGFLRAPRSWLMTGTKSRAMQSPFNRGGAVGFWLFDIGAIYHTAHVWHRQQIDLSFFRLQRRIHFSANTLPLAVGYLSNSCYLPGQSRCQMDSFGSLITFIKQLLTAQYGENIFLSVKS